MCGQSQVKKLKYQVGDKVRLLSKGFDIPAGLVGTVEVAEGNLKYPYRVVFGGIFSRATLRLMESELASVETPVSFQVGDRVKYVGRDESIRSAHLEGKTGTIKAIPHCIAPEYAGAVVVWDVPSKCPGALLASLEIYLDEPEGAPEAEALPELVAQPAVGTKVTIMASTGAFDPLMKAEGLIVNVREFLNPALTEYAVALSKPDRLVIAHREQFEMQAA
ncbi:hypothetical protein [Pseudoduganella lutea]|uniref:Uncharacterized protein n=1 Tax=Pseudoduganella lutea TaxID=321985 RepID=A0A4V0Z4G5_9BURK|nr:hypothetical protein [Pseudoduganella lutea]QBE66863.1 hypothetical protein EWM63_31045 [Pseudoduganella lutea]